MVAVLSRLAQEHTIVHELISRLQQTVARLPHGAGPEYLHQIFSAFEAVESVVISHFGYEEKELEESLGYYEIPW